MTSGLENWLAAPPPTPTPALPHTTVPERSDLEFRSSRGTDGCCSAVLGTNPMLLGRLIQSILSQPSTLSTEDGPIYNTQEKFYGGKTENAPGVHK